MAKQTLTQEGCFTDDSLTKINANFTELYASTAGGTLTSAHLLVGNSSNVATDTAITGDVTIGNTGVTAIGANKVTAAKMASGGVGYAAGVGGTVTQITSSSTGVTLNKICGTIVTVALTTAAGAHELFTVTNSTCAAATDVILLSTTYVGGASHGTPVLQAVNVTAGTFDIVIANVDATNALNAAMTINFVVIPSVAA